MHVSSQFSRLAHRFRRAIAMNLCSQKLVVEVILEVLMVMAPTYLDNLGAAGEFILKLNQSTIEFTL
ncbi:hypothetical protein K9N68_39805 (plasmid) [Kovacikia minuta CCNUW1]|uniref:hypothetical protein n=1 Tax=Kovacikia minuta TaxID=2931930 RepID=UPI001CCBD91B|nr:hypothetical protein [Kovacikia minuta]UBF30744.1 hypothetical protein K9N68_39805 [Kovacikia minuta CCNUW1]